MKKQFIYIILLTLSQVLLFTACDKEDGLKTNRRSPLTITTAGKVEGRLKIMKIQYNKEEDIYETIFDKSVTNEIESIIVCSFNDKRGTQVYMDEYNVDNGCSPLLLKNHPQTLFIHLIK